MDSTSKIGLGFWCLLMCVVLIGVYAMACPKTSTVRITNLSPDEIDVTVLREGVIVWNGAVDGSATLELKFKAEWFRGGDILFTVQFPNTLYEKEINVSGTAVFVYEG